MSDIFISYAHEDRPRAQTLAQTLEHHRWSIFWDRTIPAGKTWRETIGKELANARCVVVLWSNASIKSDWVQEEADDAKQRGILIPVLIENVEPPIGFRSVQAAHLENWTGTESTQPFQGLIADIGALIGPPPKEVPKEPPSAPPSPQPPQSATLELRESAEQHKAAAGAKRSWVIAGLGGFAVLVILGLWQTGPPVAPYIAPTAAPQDASARVVREGSRQGQRLRDA